MLNFSWILNNMNIKQKWYLKNRQRISSIRLKYYEFNKNIIKKNQAVYYEKNKEFINSKRRNKRKQNLAYSNEYRSRPVARYTNSKYIAKKRGLAFNLPYKVYLALITSKCFYCGSTPRGKGIGLDRINNSYGYSIKNVLPCCFPCNQGRNIHFTVKEWKIMINALLKHRKIRKVI